MKRGREFEPVEITMKDWDMELGLWSPWNWDETLIRRLGPGGQRIEACSQSTRASELGNWACLEGLGL